LIPSGLYYLTWNTAPGATSYRITAHHSGQAYTTVGTSFLEPTVAGYPIYTFTVVGVNSAGEGPGAVVSHDNPALAEGGILAAPAPSLGLAATLGRHAAASALLLGSMLPSFALGGMVPGLPGDEVLARVHAGEAVLPADVTRGLVRALTRRGRGLAPADLGGEAGGRAFIGTYEHHQHVHVENDRSITDELWRAEQLWRARGSTD
jgi:hypothetical protein